LVSRTPTSGKRTKARSTSHCGSFGKSQLALEWIWAGAGFFGSEVGRVNDHRKPKKAKGRTTTPKKQKKGKKQGKHRKKRKSHFWKKLWGKRIIGKGAAEVIGETKDFLGESAGTP